MTRILREFESNTTVAPNSFADNEQKKIRQAVYDIRYRARREGIDLKAAYAQYMQNSNLSGKERIEVKARLFGKPGQGTVVQSSTMGESMVINVSELVSKSSLNALTKVFVENKKTIFDLADEYLTEFKERNNNNKYKVRVTDKNSKITYIRWADRRKIEDLRANPNIESVEMTGYGDPYEGEEKGGKQTAAALSGKLTDMVGKEKTDEPKKKSEIKEGINLRADKTKTIDCMPPGKTNAKIVKLNPSTAKDVNEAKKSKGEKDHRSLPTELNLIKTRLRLGGLKNLALIPISTGDNRATGLGSPIAVGESTRYAKETGKSFRTGRDSVPGGSAKDDEAFKQVSKGLRRVGVQPRGAKKVPGQKFPNTETPVSKFKKSKEYWRNQPDHQSSRFD